MSSSSGTSPSADPKIAVIDRNKRLWRAVDRFFSVTSRQSSIKTELIAGLSTFLAIAYIFIVNPAILANAGINRNVSLFATIAVSAIATLAMGVWARLPFVVSTGMEMNAYVAFFVVGVLGFAWQEALGMVFWAGIAMSIVTLTPLREQVIDSIPIALRLGLSFSVGIFLILIALRVSGVLLYDGLALAGFGSVISPAVLALCFCLVCIALLERVGVVGSVLFAILLTAALLRVLDVRTETSGPIIVDSRMLEGMGAFNLSIIFDPRAVSVILVLFVLDFYGSIAKIITLARGTTVLADDGRLPRRKQALLVDGIGTASAAWLGTTSVVVFVESAVGIGAGGRTGLVAVVCGALMLLTLIAFPVVELIPIAATTGALVYVGVSLCPALNEVKKFAWHDRLILASMPAVTIVTFSIDRAMLAGFLIATTGQIIMNRRMPNRFLFASTVLLAVGVILQIVRL